MKQPQQISTIIKKDTLPTATYMSNHSELSAVSQQRAAIVIKRFGDSESFMKKVSPSEQTGFAAHPDNAIMGDYPTLTDLKQAYGKNFAAIWLVPQIDNLTLFTGAKNITEQQHEELSKIIAAEYGYLKVTELLLFFHRFKAGHYGRFYGSVDPMVITCALRDFIKERNIFIDQYEREKKEREAESKPKVPTMTHEEYLKLKESENKET